MWLTILCCYTRIFVTSFYFLLIYFLFVSLHLFFILFGCVFDPAIWRWELQKCFMFFCFWGVFCIKNKKNQRIKNRYSLVNECFVKHFLSVNFWTCGKIYNVNHYMFLSTAFMQIYPRERDSVTWLIECLRWYLCVFSTNL